jgi:hypothetical protein
LGNPAIRLNIGITNKLVRSVMYIQKHAKNISKIKRRGNIAILPIIAVRIALPLLLPQGFVAVVALLKVGVMDMPVPLLLASVGPQEKEPPDGFF